MWKIPTDLISVATVTRATILEKLATVVSGFGGIVTMRGPEILLGGYPVAYVETRLHRPRPHDEDEWSGLMELRIVARDLVGLPDNWSTSWNIDVRDPDHMEDEDIYEAATQVVDVALWNWEAREREDRKQGLVTELRPVELDLDALEGMADIVRRGSAWPRRTVPEVEPDLPEAPASTSGPTSSHIEHPAGVFQAAGFKVESRMDYFAITRDGTPGAAADQLSVFPFRVVYPWSGGTVDFSEANVIKVWNAGTLRDMLGNPGGDPSPE